MVSDKERPKLQHHDLGNVPNDRLGDRHLSAGTPVRLTVTEWMPILFWSRMQDAQGNWWVVGVDHGDEIVNFVRLLDEKRNTRERADEVAAALNRIYRT